MIISHQYRFIFIKTAKTAGTSVEIALSKFCGPDDVITPISPKDEATRRELGYRGAQNFRIPLRHYGARDFAKALYSRKPLAFYHHAPASFIREYVDADVWNSYFKFTIERNPFDKAISWYYWVNHGERSLEEFILAGGTNYASKFDLYAIDGEIVVDEVYRYEQMDAAMADLQQRLGLPEAPELPHAKVGTRKDPRNYREVLTPAARRKIEQVCARELAYHGYTW